MECDFYQCPGGLKDIEEFIGKKLNVSSLSPSKPIEVQGVLDSLSTMQFLIFLEKKYKKRLSQEEIQSIMVYEDLIEKFKN